MNPRTVPSRASELIMKEIMSGEVFQKLKKRILENEFRRLGNRILGKFSTNSSRITRILIDILPFFSPLFFLYIFRTKCCLDASIDDVSVISSVSNVLGTLVQSEGTILAIITTLTLVVMQLAASAYSWRVIKIFQDIHMFWIYMLLYVSSILYTLYVLKKMGIASESPESSLGVLVCICHLLGIACFTALIPYTYNLLAMLEVPNIVNRLTKDITKRNLLENDPIFPIIEVFGKIMRNKETIRKSLDRITKIICDILGRGELGDGDQTNISKKIDKSFSEIGRLFIRKRENELALDTITNLREISEIAVDRKFGTIIVGIVSSLREIGLDAIDKEVEKIVRETISSLVQIEGATMLRYIPESAAEVAPPSRKANTIRPDEKSKEASTEAVLSLKEIGVVAVKKGLPEVAIDVVSSLKDIMDSVTNEDFWQTAENIGYSIGEIGKSAKGRGFEEVVQKSVSSLREIREKARLEEGKGEISFLKQQITQRAMSYLERIPRES